MIDKNLQELEEKIKRSPVIPKEKQNELIALLSSLKSEITELAKTKNEAAESIAGFTKISTHEATRRNKDQHLIDLSLKGLSSSVREFEATHPKLVERVNAICTMLANLGI